MRRCKAELCLLRLIAIKYSGRPKRKVTCSSSKFKLIKLEIKLKKSFRSSKKLDCEFEKLEFRA